MSSDYVDSRFLFNVRSHRVFDLIIFDIWSISLLCFSYFYLTYSGDVKSTEARIQQAPNAVPPFTFDPRIYQAVSTVSSASGSNSVTTETSKIETGTSQPQRPNHLGKFSRVQYFFDHNFLGKNNKNNQLPKFDLNYKQLLNTKAGRKRLPLTLKGEMV